MTWRLTAQPIHEDGSVGFGDRSPLFHEAETVAECFAVMASEEGDAGDVGILAYAEEYAAWHLTLEKIG